MRARSGARQNEIAIAGFLQGVRAALQPDFRDLGSERQTAISREHHRKLGERSRCFRRCYRTLPNAGCAALFCSFDFHGVFYVVKRAQWLLWRGPHSPQSKAPDNSLKGRMSGAFVVLRLILVLIFGFIDRETSEVKGFGVRLSANLKVGHQLLDFGILMLWVFRSG